MCMWLSHHFRDIDEKVEVDLYQQVDLGHQI